MRLTEASRKMEQTYRGRYITLFPVDNGWEAFVEIPLHLHGLVSVRGFSKGTIDLTEKEFFFGEKLRCGLIFTIRRGSHNIFNDLREVVDFCLLDECF